MPTALSDAHRYKRESEIIIQVLQGFYVVESPGDSLKLSSMQTPRWIRPALACPRELSPQCCKNRRFDVVLHTKTQKDRVKSELVGVRVSKIHQPGKKKNIVEKSL